CSRGSPNYYGTGFYPNFDYW
nr:immunoglobulin heavy chain junction region [Macaca mulatta]MOW94081.1 immunoglobulin heavy chain junction region [Macaca mulatta]MOW94287.1 immunoglobulin heavy chain junction region [Macaca mulatta]MOW94429.1 immunoglobulin heavy chain junction region [Macaca mulatta]MOW94522.1 immunoglobulin heavy chain junction region [Macaca mulatta]